MKDHLEHPTQAFACGSPASAAATAMARDEFRASDNQCGRCRRVLEALNAGRPAYSGIEPAAMGEESR